MPVISEYSKYQEEVISYLEYIGFPDYVLCFEPTDVARSIAASIAVMYSHDVSIRMCALAIFGVVWKHQIVPSAKKMTIQ